MIPVFKLHFVKFTILSIKGHEFLMCALLDNPTLYNHDDAISIANGGESVGDDEGRATLHQVLKGLLNSHFRLSIQ